MKSKLPQGVVLCSGSASSLRYLHDHDPNFGTRYEIIGVFSDVSGASGLRFAVLKGISAVALDFGHWCEACEFDRRDLVARQLYFQDVRTKFDEMQWKPDFIILSGFMLIVTDPLLSAFRGCILNVHPALLSISDGKEGRLLTGLNVVARAMELGLDTGSTVHIVTDQPDMGPIIAESEVLPYQQGDDPEAHQQKMKTACDGPAFARALEFLIDSGWPGRPWRS